MDDDQIRLYFELPDSNDRFFYYETELTWSIAPDDPAISSYEEDQIRFSESTGTPIYLQEGTYSGMNSYNHYYTWEFDDPFTLTLTRIN